MSRPERYPILAASPRGRGAGMIFQAAQDAAQAAPAETGRSGLLQLLDWLREPLYADVTPLNVGFVLVLIPIIVVGARILQAAAARVLDNLEVKEGRQRDVTLLVVQYGTIAIGAMIALRQLSLESAFDWLNEEIVPGQQEITPIKIVVVVGIVLLTFQISKAVQRFATRILNRAGIDNEAATGTVGRLIHYTIVAVGFLVAVNQLGFELKTLFTAGAVFAVVLGFAMQNISQNFVAGVILLIERSIKPGDVLKVEGQIVRVVEMGIRVTVARTLDEEELIIPNATLAQTTVKNYTLRDPLYRLRAKVGVVYSSDMELVAKTLEETARSLEWRHKERAPRVHLLDFGDNSVNWEVSVWVQNPWHAPRQLSRLNQSIWWALKEKGIVIAFPQLDVHLDPRFESLISRSLAERLSEKDDKEAKGDQAAKSPEPEPAGSDGD